MTTVSKTARTGASARGAARQPLRRRLAITGAVVVVLSITLVVYAAGRGGHQRVAFAEAPPGDYLIYGRSDALEDVIYAVRTDDAGNPIEVGRIPHVPEEGIRGTVSPDGRFLAAVAAIGGTPARPAAGLIVLDLETSLTRRIADGVDLLQVPVWSADSQGVLFTRSSRPAENGLVDAKLLLASADGGGEREVASAPAVLGAYPVGFDAAGSAISVVIGGAGSTAWRDGAPLMPLSDQITRDWKLSPDGRQLAFIESNVTAGLRYSARTVALDASPAPGSASSVQSASATGQALGVAWDPRTNSATFGRDGAGTSMAAGVSAQSAGGSGFDVPMGYAPNAHALAVQHWSGSGYNVPGEMVIQIVDQSGRTSVKDATKVFGWSAR